MLQYSSFIVERSRDKFSDNIFLSILKEKQFFYEYF